MGLQTKHVYEFGPYRLDSVKRILAKQGEAVSLTPKTFDTLLTLVENHGSVVEKDDLMKTLWPDSFVEEGNLSVNVSMLRKALGETPNHHQYIVTVPGRGYQFVASVRELFEDGADLIVEEHTSARLVIEQKEWKDAGFVFREVLGRTFGRWTATTIRGVGVLILCLIAGLVWWKVSIRPTTRAGPDWRASLQFTRLAGLRCDRKESMNSGRLSPDGNLIALSSTGEGLNLWIRQIDGGQPLQITSGPWHDDTPVWSPNGRRIAFISDRNNQLGIWTVLSLGHTEPTLLKTLEAEITTLKGGTAVRHWSRDGKTIYFSWRNNVHKINVDTMEIVQLTTFDPDLLFNREYRISPDEEWIAYVDKNDEQFDIWRVSTKGGAPIQVTNDRIREHRPVWHPDGTRIIYSARLDGGFRINEAYIDGRPPDLITFTEEESYVWDISADGTRLLYRGLRDESDLWEINTETKEDSQLTSDIGLEFWPQASPDGGAIVYQALHGSNIVWDPKNTSLVVQSTATGGKPAEVADKGFEPQWSPDSRKIAFLHESNGVDNLMLVEAAGGEQKQLSFDGVIFPGSTIGPPFNRFGTKAFGWSPDGGRIAYCSARDGSPNVWLVGADGSNETKVSDNGDAGVNVSCPIWSPEGDRIAYITNTGDHSDGKQSWSLWVTEGGRTEFVFRTEAMLRLLGWTSSGNEVAVAMAKNQGMNKAFPTEINLARISIKDRSVQAIARIDSAYVANVYLSPDGRNISYVSTYEGRDNIWVLPVNGGEGRKITSNSDPKSYYAGLAFSPDGKRVYYAKQSSWSLIMLVDNLK